MDPVFSAITDLVPLVILISVRVGVALAALPAPFGQLAPVTIRAALGILIALALAIPHAGGLDPELSALWIGRAAVGEMLIGGVLGVTVRLTLAAAEIAGTFAGFSMGMGFASSIDPMMGEQSIPTSRLMGSFAVLIFLIMQGHHIMLKALVRTLEFAPPGDAFSAISGEGIVGLATDLFSNALRIAAPVVATMFIVQLGTGLVSRAAPKVHIFTLSFAVASAAGMLTLFIAAPSLAAAISQEIEQLPDRLVAAF